MPNLENDHLAAMKRLMDAAQVPPDIKAAIDDLESKRSEVEETFQRFVELTEPMVDTYIKTFRSVVTMGLGGVMTKGEAREMVLETAIECMHLAAQDFERRMRSMGDEGRVGALSKFLQDAAGRESPRIPLVIAKAEEAKMDYAQWYARKKAREGGKS